MAEQSYKHLVKKLKEEVILDIDPETKKPWLSVYGDIVKASQGKLNAGHPTF